MIYRDWREFLPRRLALRQAGLRLAATNGCFDLLHAGHVELLERARACGDCLLVAVNRDAAVRAAKGPQRPVVPEAERAELLAALAAVDEVALFAEPEPRELYAALLPDVLVKGADWAADAIVGREEIEAAGGEVVRIPLVFGRSTTNLITRIQAGR